MAEEIKGLVQHRNKTHETHEAENKVLFDGEISIEKDSKLLKVGDGATAYNSLPYINHELVTSRIEKLNTCGVLLPAYVYPADIYNNVEYKGLIDQIKLNETVPFIIVVNAASGPGTVYDSNYGGAIELLKGAGATVIGYVSTVYGDRDIQLVLDDLDKWKELYPNLDGMFFDEMHNVATPERLTYYSNINRHAKGLGQEVTVANPGTLFDKGYITAPAADIIVGWETGAFPSLAEAEDYVEGGAAEYTKFRRSLMVHSQLTWDETEFQQACDYFGWLYVTEDLLSPNPWDTFSSYMADMINGIKSRH